MIALNDYVTRKGTNNPTGVVTALNGTLTATVLWGVDRARYSEEIPQEQLQVLLENIVSADEIAKRQSDSHKIHPL